MFDHRASPSGETDRIRLVLPGPPDPAALLGEIETLLQRYVVLRPAQYTAVALWVMHTHAFEAAEVTPYLQVFSPEKGSGKTRLLEVLELLVAKPWRVTTPSEAVIFRMIEETTPTLLLDEYDTIFDGKGGNREGLRGILNSGYRLGAKVPRCESKPNSSEQKIVNFRVFCPKVLAGLRDLPDTVADRSIPILMRKRGNGEEVERFRFRDAEKETADLLGRLAAWAEVAAPALREMAAEPLADLSDRLSEAWEPLLSIADHAGGDWPARARLTARTLCGATDQAEDHSIEHQLLADCHRVIQRPAMPTGELLTALQGLPGRPWNSWSNHWSGDCIDPISLSRMLRPYGVKPKSIRFGEERSQGYEYGTFLDAFTRYLPDTPDSVDTEATNVDPGTVGSVGPVGARGGEVPF
jgi:hypothetical protein